MWVLPVFALLGGLLVYPLVSGLLLSLRRTTGSTPGDFVGLGNYVEALFRDDIFHQAVGNTVAFTAVAIVLQTGVGLLLGPDFRIAARPPALSAIVMVPPLVVFAALQRSFIQGLTVGAMRD